jgi:hypothetical protein
MRCDYCGLLQAGGTCNPRNWRQGNFECETAGVNNDTIFTTILLRLNDPIIILLAL